MKDRPITDAYLRSNYVIIVFCCQERNQQAMEENNNPQQQPQQPSQAQSQQQPVQPPVNGGAQPGGYYPQQPYQQPVYTAPKQRRIAVVLAFFLGSLGIHKFYMGKTVPGIIALLVSLIGSIFTCGIAICVMQIISVIECLFYLCMSDDEWQKTYIQGQKDWF